MNELLIAVLVFVPFLLGALLLYFSRFIIGRMEKYSFSKDQALVLFGVFLLVLSWGVLPLVFKVYIRELFGAGVGILLADWVMNWGRIVKRYRHS